MGRLPSKLKVHHGVGGTPIDRNHKLHQVACCMKHGIRVSSIIDHRVLRALHLDLTDYFSSDSKSSCVGQALSAMDDRGVESLHRVLGPSCNPKLMQSKHVRQIEVPAIGNFVCPPNEATFVFEDFAPDVFRRLRHAAGVASTAYTESISKEDEDLLCYETNSKSGQFFFFCNDGLYLIKSVTEEEAHKLLNILPDYEEHLQNHPGSLLTRFFGLHRILLSNNAFGGLLHGFKGWWFVVMASISYTSRGLHEQYDLKGSTHNRKARSEETRNGNPCMHMDQDFLERLAKTGPLNLDFATHNELLMQHSSDTAFLESM